MRVQPPNVRLPGGPFAIFKGVFAVLRGIGRIFVEPQLLRLAVIPLMLTALLYVGLIAAAVMWTDDLLERVWPQPAEGWLHYLWYVLVPFVFIALLAPFMLLFSTVAEAIGGPFYDKMAVKVLTQYSIAAREPGIWRGTLPDIARSLAFALASAACAALALIPGIGIAFVVLSVIVASLGFASAAINSALMVTGFGLRDRLALVFRSFFTMVGLGAVVWAALLVPFAGLIALPAAVVGATDLYAKSVRGN